ncbi:hypothetical protein EON65_44155 [archaeon]|nr:MAG: hypothetical protein EON65_44155 [archaeon]
MIANAAKYDTDDKVLIQEIQQLGLPKENSDMIAKQYRETKEALRNKFAEDSYRVSRLLSTDWRVDTVLASSGATAQATEDRIVHLNMHIDTKPGEEDSKTKLKHLAFELSGVKLDTLIKELRQVQHMIESMDS